MLACSAGPDYDAIAEADVIVEGRIDAWTPRHDLREAAAKGYGLETFIPVEVALHVERIFKGEAGQRLTFFDWSSLRERPEGTEQQHDYTWVGSGGACGIFDADPTGAAVILGLHEGETGELRSHRLTAFFIGASATGERYQWALERLSALQPTSVPTPTATSDRSPTTELVSPTTAVESASGGTSTDSSEQTDLFTTTRAILGGSIALLFASIAGTLIGIRRTDM